MSAANFILLREFYIHENAISHMFTNNDQMFTFDLSSGRFIWDKNKEPVKKEPDWCDDITTMENGLIYGSSEDVDEETNYVINNGSVYVKDPNDPEGVENTVFQSKHTNISAIKVKGKLFYIGSDDGYITIWDNKIKKFIFDHQYYDGRVTDIAVDSSKMGFSYDNGKVICINGDIHYYLKKGKALEKRLDVGSCVHSMAIFHNKFYIGAIDNIYYWDFKSKSIQSISHKAYITSFTHNNQFLISLGDPFIKFWDSKLNCIKTIQLYDNLFSPIAVFFNENIYIGYSNSGHIEMYGEYFPHHYQNLPLYQKKLINEWTQYTQLSHPIHKDIGLLITRELLSEQFSTNFQSISNTKSKSTKQVGSFKNDDSSSYYDDSSSDYEVPSSDSTSYDNSEGYSSNTLSSCDTEYYTDSD